MTHELVARFEPDEVCQISGHPPVTVHWGDDLGVFRVGDGEPGNTWRAARVAPHHAHLDLDEWADIDGTDLQVRVIEQPASLSSPSYSPASPDPGDWRFELRVRPTSTPSPRRTGP